MSTRVWWGTMLAGLVLAGCASVGGPPSVAEPVGPAKPLGIPLASQSASLRVYSATDPKRSGTETWYYPHTGYVVFDAAGHKVQAVVNHSGEQDQRPFLVRLPPGDYTVVALAEGRGRVRIPVVLQPQRVTEVYLERDWKPPIATPDADLVRFTDGQPIGWRVNGDAK